MSGWRKCLTCGTFRLISTITGKCKTCGNDPDEEPT